MRVVVAGGTGLLGSALVARLQADGNTVVVLSRHPSGAGQVGWSPDGTAGAWGGVIDGADAVVNLAGESLAAGRWTAERKSRIESSRVLATRSLAHAIKASPRPPAVFLSASAVGYYGPHGDDRLDEDAPAGADFLATVCTHWEHEAHAVDGLTRVVLLRTGVVLAREGGALAQMALPFRFFAGGPVGSGDQYWSWIHLADWVGIVAWALKEPQLSGAINLTAPAPVTNREFAATIGRVLKRPAFLPAPAFALRLLLGEMADALLLSGQRVVPARAEEGGYRFVYPTLEPALEAALVTGGL